MLEIFRTLNTVIDGIEGTEDVRRALIFAAWPKAAGTSLAEHAVPAALDGTELSVAVAGVAWKRHLEDLSSQIVFKLNGLLGSAQVTFIRFVVDEKTVEAARSAVVDDKEKRKAARLAEKEITTGLRRSAETIEDEGLRQVFLQAAGACLVRKKRHSK